MRTEDLIAALARDAKPAGLAPAHRLTLALLLAPVMALAMLILVVKPRADLAAAAGTMLFELKILFIATLTVAAIVLVRAAARPDGVQPRALMIVPALILLFGLGHEVATQPSSLYMSRLVGRSWQLCLIAIPFMAAGPLAALLLALRSAAPADPTRAGAMAGLAAAAIAALFYGLHCADDSPFFVAVWYPIGIGVVTIAGALLGRRLLAW